MSVGGQVRGSSASGPTSKRLQAMLPPVDFSRVASLASGAGASPSERNASMVSSCTRSAGSASSGINAGATSGYPDVLSARTAWARVRSFELRRSASICWNTGCALAPAMAVVACADRLRESG